MIARLLTILLLISQPIPAAFGGCAPATDTLVCCGDACCCGGDGACQCSSQDETPAPADMPMQSRGSDIAPTLPACIVSLPALTRTDDTVLPRAHRPIVPSNTRRQALLGCWHT
ncbi:MAG: hypothetical protein QGI75_03025 [Phycisphaerales bacterium]|nr:hypothetical protein [Phycisphaerales bacterium]MDP6890270.1 hypothetical protein [Phycisphaerales bacterium]